MIKPIDDEIEEIAMISMWFAKGNLEEIEDELSNINNPFLYTGIQLLIDGIPPEDINNLLKWRILKLKQREQAEADVFISMANFAPAFGMAGTLLGLVNMLFGMSNSNFDVIGSNMAIALTTTLYGIILANLFLRPIAIKLERRTERRIMIMHMVLEGLGLLEQGRRPRYIRETLNSFIAQYEDEINSPSLEQLEENFSKKFILSNSGNKK